MSHEDDVRAAEKAVIDAARRWLDTDDGAYNPFRLRERVNALDALQSPLPSREAMCARTTRLYDRDTPKEVDTEQHWADCLRWVAKHERDLIREGSQQQLRLWADELEARK